MEHYETKHKSNSEAVNLLQILISIKKVESYKYKKFAKIFVSIYKNGKTYKIWWHENSKTKISPT